MAINKLLYFSNEKLYNQLYDDYLTNRSKYNVKGFNGYLINRLEFALNQTLGEPKS